MTTLLRDTRLLPLALLLHSPAVAAPLVGTAQCPGGAAMSVSAAAPPMVEVSSPFYRAFIVSEGYLKGRLAASSGPQHPDALRPLPPARSHRRSMC